MGTLLHQIRKSALRVPLFWISLSAIFGILAADQHFAWVIFCLALCFLFFQKRRAAVALVVGMLVVWALFAWSHAHRISQIKTFPLLSSLSQRDSVRVTGRGWISSETNRNIGQAVRVSLTLEELKVRGANIPLPNRDRVVAFIDQSFMPDLSYGTEIEFSGRMKKIEKARSPGAFDPETYFYRSANAVAEVTINPGERCDPTGQSRGSRIKKRAIRSRKWMEQALVHGLGKHQEEMSGVILAMALGAKEKSPDDVEDFFRLSGTMHIFAVSGLHVGVVAGMFWFLMKWAGVSRRSSVFFIIPAILFYALLTGLRPSSFRAATMLSIFLAGILLKRKQSPINGIGLAGLILLGLNSQQLFLPGFQLSFCVVLALTLLGTLLSDKIYLPFRMDEFIPLKRVRPWRLRTDRVVRFFTMAAGVSLASWLGSVILMNSHFKGISPVGLLANIFMVPIASLIVVIAGASVLFFGIKLGAISIVLNQINVSLAIGLAFLAQFFAEFPGAHIHTGRQDEPIIDQTISLDVMGMRGGSAILAESERQRWMIDSGGMLTFRHQVLPLLRSRGINRLDCLVLTHGDSGHIGAAPYLLNHLTPDIVIESPFPNRARVYPQISKILEKRQIPRFQVTTGQKLRWNDDTYWEPLFPSKKDPPTGVADDRCLVMRLRSGPWKILFTFDAGFLIERQLIQADQNIESDIWIRGQHSSNPSGTSEFLHRVDPQVVVSTQARFPPYEKLSSDWMKLVQDSGAKLITLDDAGCVNLQITKDELKITQYLVQEKTVLTR